MKARAAVVSVLGLLFVAAPAHAGLYCVPTTIGCPGGTASPTIQSALDSAEAAGGDEIVIQPGTYTGNFLYDPSVADAGGLQIVPRALDSVTLRSNVVNLTTLSITADSNDSDTSVQDLTIQAPDSGVGLSTYGDVSSVDIRSAAGAQDATGLILWGSSSATGVDIQMDDNGQPVNRGLDLEHGTGNAAGDATILRTHIESTDGVRAQNAFSLKRSTLVTGGAGIDMVCVGSADIDTVVHTVIGGFGLRSRSDNGCSSQPSVVDVRHLTLVSENPSAGPALRVNANQGGEARLTVRSSIVLGFAKVVERVIDSNLTTHGDINVGYSLADLSLVSPFSTGGGATDLGGNFVADPLFFDGPARDYRPVWPAPTIDAGHPLPLGSGESTVDMLGEQRLFDGDGDGVARRDAGAFEYVGVAPKVSVSPNPAVVGQPVTFDASQSHHLYGPLNYAWNWDDGGSVIDVASVAHTFATPGTHTGTVSIGDGTGGPRAEQAFSVVVNAAPSASPPSNPETPPAPSATSTPSNPSAPPGAVVADTAAPSLTARLLKKRFKRRKGGMLELKLNEAATVSVVVERCTKRKARRCTRYEQASSKSVKSPLGTSRVALKPLRTGPHRVRVRATDAAGNRSPERTAAFTVTR